MNTQTRRYLFIDYENLLQVKFKKLEKVASKIFIFVESSQETVPLALVRQAQRSGKNLRWIVVNNAGGGKLNYHIAFIMGKLHQKLEDDVEFAVVSNDSEFDPLISFINTTGRSCIRVKRKQDESSVYEESSLNYSKPPEFVDEFSMSSFSNHDDDDDGMPVMVEEELITRTAEETVKRLIRSGNRPAEISTLKNYILLHSQEVSLHGNVDRIIQKLKDTKDIEIQKGEVIYNF
jgi:PIN domain